MEEKYEKEKRIEEEEYPKSLIIKRVKMDSLMKDNITLSEKKKIFKCNSEKRDLKHMFEHDIMSAKENLRKRKPSDAKRHNQAAVGGFFHDCICERNN